MWFVRKVVAVASLVSLAVATQSYDAQIPYGTRFKTSKVSRRQTSQDVPAKTVIQGDRFPRGLVYQQPFFILDQGYSYPAPTTEEPRGYIYKKPTTTTTTTTPEPAIEQEYDVDSASLTPAPPPPSFPEKEFEAPIDDDEDKWDIRNSVPGTPGENYPVLGHIPKTSFSCEGRIPGFYGDPETKCQVYHRCSDCSDNVRLQMDSFLCPNGTQFNQEILACDWWSNVHCENTRNFYKINEELNQLGPDGKYLQLSGMRHAPPLLQKKVAPGIIPKAERRRLPDIYRSQHKGHAEDHDVKYPTQTPTQPTRKDPPILFNEFRKPVATPPTTKNPIESALDNPDYFDPDANVQRQDPRKEPNDDDYFNGNEQVEVRSSIEYAQKLDNDPLRPAATSNAMDAMRSKSKAATKYPFVMTSPTSKTTKTTTIFTTLAPTTIRPTTTRPTTTTRTTFFVESTLPVFATTQKPESAERENEVQPLVGFQAQLHDEDGDDDASGFIVNQSQDTRKNYNNRGNKGSEVGLRPPARVTDADVYLPPTTYAPPTTLKPKLNYLPPKDQYGPPKDSYLPEVGPKQAIPPPPALPAYPGNPFLQAPLPQQAVLPSTFNYVPLNSAFLGNQLQPTFKIVTSHVPVLNFAQFHPGISAQPALSPYFNGFDLTALGSTNFATVPRYNQG